MDVISTLVIILTIFNICMAFMEELTFTITVASVAFGIGLIIGKIVEHFSYHHEYDELIENIINNESESDK